MARRVVLFVLGGVLLVVGALAAIGGGALMVLFGSDNTLDSGVQQVSTPTRALVSPAGSIQGASGAQTVVGSVRLRITATPSGTGQHLFLGIGPASAVNKYLRGASYDVATDVSVTPFHLTLARHRGTATPPPPGLSVVLGGQGERRPSDPDVDGYLRLLPGGRDERRRCRSGGLRRGAGSDHPALVRDRYRPAHRRHRAHPDSDHADRARCPGPAAAAVPARSRYDSRELAGAGCSRRCCGRAEMYRFGFRASWA